MATFNKKQKAYLDKVVHNNPTRMELAQAMFDTNTVEAVLEELGGNWETQWSDADRYLNDKFIEVHGAKMNGYY